MKRTGFKNTGKGFSQSSGFKQPTKGLSQGAGKLKQSHVKGKSTKQSATDRAYSETLKQRGAKGIPEAMACASCASFQSPTNSHLVPRSRRPDLITEPRNIVIHCLVCHPIWESPDRVGMTDYEDNMAVVKELDSEYYHLLIMKQEDHVRKRSSNIE